MIVLTGLNLTNVIPNYDSALLLNLLLLISLTLFNVFFFGIGKLGNLSTSQSFRYLSGFLKSLNIVSYLISLFLFLTYFYGYLTSQSTYIGLASSCSIRHSINLNLGINQFYLTNLSVNFFGLMLTLLAYIVGFLSLLSYSDKLFWSNKAYSLLFSYFIIVVLLLTITNDIWLLFISYELLLLPSFLLVYLSSSNKKGIQASLYFLIWTQLGSLIVFLTLLYISTTCASSNFERIYSFQFTDTEAFYIYLFLFIGFGFKVPLWPFHYWLTKTHVEAPGSFSMYLSGFLVKTALYGFYQITMLIDNQVNTIPFVCLAVMGICDASFKMWCQTDLKKIVAFCTVQEMNLIYISFLFGNSSTVIVGILFCFMHAILSSLMFFLVDCIQKRYNSRSIVEVSGILNTSPNLGLSIILMCIYYMGLPGTLKFSCELMLFSCVLDISFFLFLIILFSANFLAPVAFCKSWYGCVFGTPYKKHNNIDDLDTKEFYIIVFCLFSLFFITGLFLRLM